MKQRGRPTASRLARLEQHLGELDALRHRVIAEMKKAVEHLTAGSAAPMAGLSLSAPLEGKAGRPAAAKRTRRPLSPAARAKLSRLAKARWAKAKKDGKTRLG